MSRLLYRQEGLAKIVDGQYVGRDETVPVERVPESRPWRANLVSSELDSGLHSPAIDLDFEHTWLPSSHDGHGHLLLDGIELPWWKYRILLRVFVWVGIISPDYYRHSVARKGTFLRVPREYKRHSYQAQVQQVLGQLGSIGYQAKRILQAAGQRPSAPSIPFDDDVPF